MIVTALVNRKLIYLYFIIFSVVLSLYTFQRPMHNFDMIFYSSLILKMDGLEESTIHNKMFNDIIPNNIRPDLKKNYLDSEQRQKVSNDLEYFKSHFPFYEIRPGYIFISFLLYKIGLNLFLSTYILSLFSVILGIFLVVRSINKRIHNSYLLYLIPIFLWMINITELVRISTPDPFIFLMICWFFSVFIKRNLTNSIFLISPLFVFFRTDMIILSLVLFFYSLFSRREIFKSSISFGLALIIYLTINSLYENYGWETIIRYTFIEKIGDFSSYSVSVEEYLTIIGMGLKKLWSKSFLTNLLFLLANIYLFNFLRMKKMIKSTIFGLLIITISYISIHFILFPVPWVRFFQGFYLINFSVFLILLDKFIIKSISDSTK